MNAHPAMEIEVAGHTDNTGSAEANLSLSEQRAAIVAKHLIDAGIESSRVTSAGYGQDVPKDTNDTEEGRANNRRTEIKITNS
ncbi:UNVERIFIED_CONTAM: hypothetical protein GTU68_007686 [Idotea baltica]|nr:hypothetical protein [Idotea baltica]